MLHHFEISQNKDLCYYPSNPFLLHSFFQIPIPLWNFHLKNSPTGGFHGTPPPPPFGGALILLDELLPSFSLIQYTKPVYQSN